ncbi:hypothetical protein, partial [Streptomyces sp. GC420]|uniref:hypothetical protein n=1 Tax=Streptomyces sp. GC420 TaxID=2697568 RepID=UPI001AA1BC66
SETEQNGVPAKEQQTGTAPAAPAAPARGAPLPVPASGECLLFSFMAGAPSYVRDTLTTLAETSPEAYEWLRDAERVREELHSRATILSAWNIPPAGEPAIVAAAMREHVADYVRASGGRLHPQILGQLRLTAPGEGTFARRIAALDRPGLVGLLTHHGVAPEQFAALDDAGLRAELLDVYATSTAPLDETELAEVLHAVRNWRTQWMTATGETFLPLLAHAFGTRVEVARNGRYNSHAGPEDATRAVEVHYFGRNHYTGSGAGPWNPAPAGFGEPVRPKRVKEEEKDPDGDVRVNPLWTPLDEVDPDLLITGNKDAVWLYTVTPDMRVLLGSEKPSDIITEEQFDALLAGMRSKDPGLTEEALREQLDGLGHTGIGARFTGSGTTVPGDSRVSGEFRWNPALGKWTVTDKSGRYMSGSVRPGLDPVQAAGWLGNVAGLFGERLGVTVVPDQVKTGAVPPPAPKPAAQPGPAPGQPPGPPSVQPPPPQQVPPAVEPAAPPPAEPAVVAGLFAESLTERLREAQTDPGLTSGTVSTAELEAVGVVLSPGQAAQAVLLGGGLAVGEVNLTPLQLLRLTLLRRGHEVSVTTDFEALAAAAGTALGIAIVISGPGERTRRFGPGTGPSVPLLFDGSRFTSP